MEHDAAYLLDVLVSARKIGTYVEGVMRDEFFRDTKLQDSVIRRLEIIGEAAGRVSPIFREENPHIPWNDMRAMRNRMIHGYDDIDMDIVWETVQQDIPRLVAQLESLVPPEVKECPARS